MKIDILCTDEEHPVFSLLQEWQDSKKIEHEIGLASNKTGLSGGDILFLVSCSEVIDSNIRSRYKVSLVLHASDLPEGRGWSPHIWQILEGKNTITMTLLEAEDKVDSGVIWAQHKINFNGNELVDEINSALFDAEIQLMNFAIDNYGAVKVRTQDGTSPTYYPKRSPKDSRIDPHKSIVEQFNILRVSDPVRYPAFFDHLGSRYKIMLTKVKDITNE